MSEKPLVMVLGVTGQLGKLVADRLQNNEKVSLQVTSRRESDLPKLKAKYGRAVHIDLDDPRTFANALKGVHSLFLLTGYTVAMLVQSKALVDAARKAGVKHIVHLGVFTVDEDCYDAHFAWHQLVETYIKASGIAWTFLHPNCFMQNFTGFYGMVKDGKVKFYSGNTKLGWIALEDVADASAKILTDVAPHASKDYWFSTQSANLQELASIFSEVTGQSFTADSRAPDQFMKDMGGDRNSLDAYFVGVEDFFVQLEDGRLSYISDVRDDMPMLVGRKGTTIKEWVTQHKDDFLKRAGKKE